MESAPPSIVVRPARHEDIAALSRIWCELMDMHERTDYRFALADNAAEAWRQMAAEVIARDDTFLLVATQASDPVGFCLGWVAKNPPIYRVSEVGFISEVAVTERVRRRGVGTALLEHARGWFISKGLGEFQLSTAIWNTGARGLWEKQGGEQLLIRYRFAIGP